MHRDLPGAHTLQRLLLRRLLLRGDSDRRAEDRGLASRRHPAPVPSVSKTSLWSHATASAAEASVAW